ncbi:CMGC/CDK protein kinase [Edhazardia aedis USNM 41457]|uniref:CMGC/CDK protein kinase n=1 Tax=Edhazardia aedis (strain USNM 41457) TaxID=1003232 RepID=J8ZW20_EDHAE|nr:CMGC/CDK protein kinase [Edhazardia aedis USNM 41457]|eukprot:EJW03878.1 CMGC/CDK protein kinase [Edhazardia aedis USNM 41457]
MPFTKLKSRKLMESSEEGEIKFKDGLLAFKQRFEHKIIKKIGEGTFGHVFLSLFASQQYALKKIAVDGEEGISITTLREILILKKLDHKNIIKILDIITDIKHEKVEFDRKNVELYVVFPYYKFDLLNLLSKNEIAPNDIKYIAKQIVEGLKYLHKNKVIHRDLKSANILLDEKLNTVIADFGLARNFDKYENFTTGLITLWYRPPEILLGSSRYTEAVDIWSLGCIIAELYVRSPILPGENEMEQLQKIIYLCGTINERTFPGVSELKYYDNMSLPQGINKIKQLFSKFDKNLPDLLQSLLNVDPRKRLNSSQILHHPYFK